MSPECLLYSVGELRCSHVVRRIVYRGDCKVDASVVGLPLADG